MVGVGWSSMNSMISEYQVSVEWTDAWKADVSYPYELCQGAVDMGSTGEEETTSRTQIVEEEQLLFLHSTFKHAALMTSQIFSHFCC